MAASSSLRMVRRPWLRNTRLLAGARDLRRSRRREGPGSEDEPLPAAGPAAVVDGGSFSLEATGPGRPRRLDSRRSHAPGIVVPGPVQMANLTRWSGFAGAGGESAGGHGRPPGFSTPGADPDISRGRRPFVHLTGGGRRPACPARRLGPRHARPQSLDGRRPVAGAAILGQDPGFTAWS